MAGKTGARDFYDFEKELHARLMEAEREIVGTVMAASDVDADAIEIAGRVHRRVLRSAQTYMTAAGPVAVERWLYKHRRDPTAHACVVELQAVVNGPAVRLSTLVYPDAIDFEEQKTAGATVSHRTPFVVADHRWIHFDVSLIVGGSITAKVGPADGALTTLLDKVPLGVTWTQDLPHLYLGVFYSSGPLVGHEAYYDNVTFDASP